MVLQTHLRNPISQSNSNVTLSSAFSSIINPSNQVAYPHNAKIPFKARYKVGFLSNHFKDHPVGHHIQGLLNFHDPALFDIACFTSTSVRLLNEDRFFSSIDAACGGVVELPPSPEDAVASLVASNIDVLVYLDGYDKSSPVSIAMARPAPVVVSFFGYLATLGSSNIDFFIGDKYSVPESDKKYYHDKSVVFPDPDAPMSTVISPALQ